MTRNKRSAFVDNATTKFVEHTAGEDAGKVRYFEAGQSEVPLLVLYTGGIWRSPAAHELLAQDRRVIRLVVPGFVHDYGEVAQEVGSLNDVIDTLCREIDALKLTGFDLMGSSLAAGFATALALRRPELVRSLVLVSPSILISKDADGGKVVMGPEDLRSRFVGTDSDVTVPEVSQANIDILESRVARLFSPSDRLQIELQLATLKAPTLIIFGTDDRIIGNTAHEQYSALMSDASIAVIEGAGHVPEVEKPDAFAKLIDKFLPS